MSRSSGPPAAFAVFALLVTGCGSGDGGASAPSGESGQQALQVSADRSGALKFDVSELSANAGTVSIEMANPSVLPHAVAVKGNGRDEQGETVGNGGASTVSADLEPGLYSFYCPVGGHEDAGMKGTLRVR